MSVKWPNKLIIPTKPGFYACWETRHKGFGVVPIMIHPTLGAQFCNGRLPAGATKANWEEVRLIGPLPVPYPPGVERCPHSPIGFCSVCVEKGIHENP